MPEQVKEKLSSIHFGPPECSYIQGSRGLQKCVIKKDVPKFSIIGQIYLYQLTIIRDIEDRFEPLYNLKYEDMVYNETKIVKNKTFEELVNFIDKQKLITEKKSTIQFILRDAINFQCDRTCNNVPFVIKEKIDFKKEKLPMKKI